jgi:hypothetical protein
MAPRRHARTPLGLLLAGALLVLGCGEAGPSATTEEAAPFALAMIPDTQNYVDFRERFGPPAAR